MCFKYSDASYALWSATRGHPGLVRLCIDAIRSALLPQVKRGDRADDGTIMAFLLSCDFVHHVYKTRILPEQYNFDQEVMCTWISELFKEHRPKKLNKNLN